MKVLPARPRREPDLVFERASDGELVEVWATRHSRRSHDRQVDGLPYFRALVAVGGAVRDHLLARHATAADAVESVRRMFGVSST